MSVPETGRVNGTYHAAAAQRERSRRTRLLIGVGGVLAAVGIINVVLINADMTRIEQSGPERLAPAGTVTVVLEGDPRHSSAFVEDKRALERWLAFTGVCLAVLFIGMEATIPVSTARPRSPTGT